MVGALRNSCAVIPVPSSSSSERDKAFFALANAPFPMLDAAALFETLAVEARVGAVDFVVLFEEEAAHAEPTDESGFPGLLLDTKAGKSSSWKALEDLVVVVYDILSIRGGTDEGAEDTAALRLGKSSSFSLGGGLAMLKIQSRT